MFNATNDGIYRIDVTLMFSEGQFNPAESPAIITQVYDDDVAPIGEPDNITWSKDGKLYVQEDSDGNQIWQLNADGTGAVLIAAAFAEPSGIDDVSALLGYEPGSVLISSVLGLGVSGAQLLVMVSPDAAPLSATADFVGDGKVMAPIFSIGK